MNKLFFSTFLFFIIQSSYANPDIVTVEDSAKVKDIEEIVIVHSPKENNKLRQQPTSVSLFDQATLDNLHTNSLKELSDFVPNFYMPDYGSSLTSAAYIRGVGSRINTPAVGLYVDHVGYADKNAYDIELLDVERIDVLRGPQATLYGRNAMGGLLRVFTRNPFRYQGTDVRMGTSVKDNGYNLSVSHHRKTGYRMAYSLSGFYKHSEGFFNNVTRHEPVGGNESGGGRVRAIWQPNEAWKLDFSSDYSYREDNGYPYRYLGTTETGEEEYPGQIGNITYNRTSFYRRSLLNGNLNLQYTAPRFVLSAVTAYQNLNDNMTLDQDFTSTDYFTMTQKQRINSWSEEVILKSPSDRRWEWVAGMYAMYQTLHTQSPVSLTDKFMNTVFDKVNETLLPKRMSIALNMHQSPFTTTGGFDTPTTDLAIFHQSVFNDLFAVEGLKLIAGIRFEYEKMQLDYDYGGDMAYDITFTSPFMPLNLKNLSDGSHSRGNLKHDYVQWLPKVSFQYDFNRENNIYISWSKGYRSGGYNIQMFSDLTQGNLKSRMMKSTRKETAKTLNSPMFSGMPENIKQMIINQIPQEDFSGDASQTRFRPEYSYNYEIGGHFTFLDRKIQLDAALFYMDIYDQQISKFVNSGLGRIMANAGSGQSCGAEIELKGRYFDNRLTWHASYGFTHSEFKRYEAQAADAASTQEAIRYDGNYVPFVPIHTMVADVEFNQPVTAKKIKAFFFGINTTGTGKIYWDESNTFRQPLYGLLNAHAGLDFGSIRLDIWGKNLTDTDYNTFFFTSAATGRERKFGQQGNPLQFGVDVSLHF